MDNVVDRIETQTAPEVLNGLPVPEIQAELDRILKSRVFVHSHRIRRFLQFVVEECLVGRQHRLKEYLIGLEVFNRQDDFDPRVDSIVRVEARRLRTKIDEYYQKEGRADEICIELRKGSYVPIFEHRRAGTAGAYSAHPPLAIRQSIAIGPLATVADDAHLVEGIKQRLSHALLQGSHFKVLADGDGAAGTRADRTDIALSSHTNPDYILEGRLERRMDELRMDHLMVHLQLLSVGDGAYVWSDSGRLDEIEHLAGSLNRAMTTSVRRRENGRTKTRSSHRHSYELYLEGRYLWKSGTPESFDRGAALFRKAVDLDPTYAAAWASLAEASLVRALFGSVDPREACPVMHEAANQATLLDGLLPEARLAMAAVKSLAEWDWTGGERDFQSAIQLDARDPIVHVAYGLQLACRGMLKAAILEVECALELDPASLIVNFVLGWLLGVSRRYDEAISQHLTVSRLAPGFALSYLGLGWAYLGKGLTSDALAHFTNAANLLRGRTVLAGCLGHCYAKLDQRDEALSQLSQLSGSSPAHYPSPVSVAAIHAGLGDHEQALDALEQAAGFRDCSLPLQLLNPEFDSLRDAARFTALLERMGLGRSRPLSLSTSGAS